MDSSKALMDAKFFQSNPLIEAKRNFSVQENRIFWLALTKTNARIPNSTHFDEELRELHVSIEELKKIYAVNSNYNWYSALQDACESIMHKNCVWLKKEGEKGKGFDVIAVFSRITFDPDCGLTMRFSEEIKDYVLDLVTNHYTVIALKDVFHLSSSYAQRLVELLLQYRGMAQHGVITRNFSIEQLRDFLGIKPDEYSRPSNFRQRVIDDPIQEIGEKTKFVITYKSIKTGRKITGFEITMYIPPEYELWQRSSKEYTGVDLEAKKLCDAWGIKRFGTLLKDWGAERIIRNIRTYGEDARGTDNPAGYLYDCIKFDRAQRDSSATSF